MNQKDGVYSAVKSLCEDKGIHFEDGMKFVPTKEHKNILIGMVATGLHLGNIEMSQKAKNKYDTYDKIEKGYAGGLISNWIRKDSRLNGGVKHETKNPGSRAYSKDKILKEMRKLRSTLTEPAEIALIDSEISSRLNELKALKNKDIGINVNNLPEDLKHLVD